MPYRQGIRWADTGQLIFGVYGQVSASTLTGVGYPRMGALAVLTASRGLPAVPRSQGTCIRSASETPMAESAVIEEELRHTQVAVQHHQAVEVALADLFDVLSMTRVDL